MKIPVAKPWIPKARQSDPILICPGCGNTGQFALRTILRYRAAQGQFTPLDAEEALELVERFSQNILFVNNRFLGPGAKMAYPLRYGPQFIAEYNDALARDVHFQTGCDIRAEYPGLILFGGLLCCPRCGVLAVDYQIALSKCRHNGCPGCLVCRL